MLHVLVYAATLLLLLSCGVASPLTFILTNRKDECFYVFTEKPNTQIGYYFAVQSGGSFDVDYVISNPNDVVVISDQKQRQGDFSFNADIVGEYEFCFSNKMLSYAEKVIDFQLKVDGLEQKRAKLPVPANSKPIEHVEQMKETINKISTQLDGLLRTMQYYKTRSNRNQATVRSTESRIYYFSVFEVVLMVGMAALQIVVVQLFFKGLRKQLV